MARIVETAKGTYKLLNGQGKSVAISTIDNQDVFEFDKTLDKLTDKEVIERIEATIDFDDCDADFLNDDFSWVHDFDSSIEVGDLY
jgi:hypothetical protein